MSVGLENLHAEVLFDHFIYKALRKDLFLEDIGHESRLSGRCHYQQVEESAQVLQWLGWGTSLGDPKTGLEIQDVAHP